MSSLSSMAPGPPSRQPQVCFPTRAARPSLHSVTFWVPVSCLWSYLTLTIYCVLTESCVAAGLCVVARRQCGTLPSLSSGWCCHHLQHGEHPPHHINRHSLQIGVSPHLKPATMVPFSSTSPQLATPHTRWHHNIPTLVTHLQVKVPFQTPFECQLCYATYGATKLVLCPSRT